MWHIFYLFSLLYLFALGDCCTPRTFDSDSFVCVCSTTDCDFLGTIPTPSDGFFTVLSSSRDELRFNLQTLPMDNVDNAAFRIFVNTSDVRQKMFGFGGAFTDATGINIATLSADLQDTLIRQYFSTEGLEYSVARIPIAGCDFSTHAYSYDDNDGDVDLTLFNLAPEDYLYKIPYISRAIEVSGKTILFFGSPWAPPYWMKTNGMANGTGGLLPEMQQPWANYFVKFLDAYNNEGIPIWGLTAQNEPTMGLYSDYRFNACGFTSAEQRDFVKSYLGPTLVAAGYENVILMVDDDSRNTFPDYPVTIFSDLAAASFVDGIAVHYYTDTSSPASLLDDVHNQFPDKFIMYTEACTGFGAPVGQSVVLGSWQRAEDYFVDISEDVNHWSSGWVEWNMALNMEGGPNWASFSADSPIIINADANEFYRQPMFYALGHFSKLIPENSNALGSSVEALGKTSNSDTSPRAAAGVYASAFVNPSNNVVITAMNSFDTEQTVLIEDTAGHATTFTMPSKSIHTITYAL